MIAVAATSFPKRPGDLAGAFVLDLSRALAARGKTLAHLCPGAPDAAVEEDLESGIHVRRVPYGRYFGLHRLTYGDGIEANVKRFPWLVAGAPLLGRAMKAALKNTLVRSPECLLSHWIFPTAHWLAPIARAARLPHVVCEHGGGIQLLARLPFGRRMLERIAESVDEIVFVSRDLEEKGARLLGRPWPCRTSVRSMGIDVAAFAPHGERERIRRERLADRSASTFVVLSVGRLVDIKGHDLAIRAVAELEGTELWIAGDGPERESLEALARRLRAPVRFLGRVDRRLMPLEFEAADVFCLASRPIGGGRTEGSPVAVAEALAAGKAVVATLTGGVRDLVTDGVSGLLLPVDDPDALSLAIERLRDDSPMRKRMEASAKATAAANDVSVVAARFAEVIDWAVRKKR